jgi:hypothetical protein
MPGSIICGTTNPFALVAVVAHNLGVRMRKTSPPGPLSEAERGRKTGRQRKHQPSAAKGPHSAMTESMRDVEIQQLLKRQQRRKGRLT